VVRGLPGLRRPFFRIATGEEISDPGRRDLDPGDAIDASRVLCHRQRGGDRGLRIALRRIRLDAAIADLEARAVSAECADVELERPGHLLEEARLALEDRGRAGEAAAGKLGREHGDAAGFGVGHALPVGQDLDPGLVHRDMPVERDVHRLGELLRGEPHQLSDRQRRRRQAVDRMIPSPVGELGGIHQPAVDLVGEHDRGEEILPARVLRLGDGEAGRGVVAGVAGRAPDIEVVEIEIADRDTVRECGELHRGLVGGPEDCRRAPARRKRDLPADAHRRLVERRNGAAEGIDQMRLGGLDRRRIEIGEPQAIRISGEAVGKIGSRRLGARHERPRRNAPEARDEFTPSHGRLPQLFVELIAIRRAGEPPGLCRRSAPR
jgi:hypothetical protein